VYLLCREALLGSLDLALGNVAAAAARLRPLAGRLAGVGRRANTQGIVPDAIEALIGAGDLEEADSPAAVTAAGSLAGIVFDRIVEVATDDAGGADDAAGQAG